MKWIARCLCVFWGLGLLDTQALQPPDYTLLLSAQAEFNPPRITIRWPVNNEARGITIRRKMRDAADWGNPIATLGGNATQFVDSNVAAGQAYEYEFSARIGDGNDAIAYGYICAGAGVTSPDLKGRVILIVDQTHAGALANELAQLRRNLVGDGWTVARRDVRQSDTAIHVRSVIQAEYNADPNNTKAVLLIGHVPVPYSGVIYPDLHWNHRGAWPSDVFYGEMNGSWTDTSVWWDTTEYSENRNVPGDGKLDQSTIPTQVELEVGRIDMWNLPAFAPRSEQELLRNYLNKNHRFRHREFTLQRRGLIRDEFGVIDNDAPAVDAWRAFPALFGISGITSVNSGQFFSTLRNEDFLFSYAGGGGNYTMANGVGTTADFAANDPRCAFFMLHGSYFGDWNNESNFLRAAIATPSYSLVSIWTSLPHWFFHRMAMGESVGSALKLVQNDRSRTYKTAWDWAVGETHISMMGDPTLRMHFIAPPRNLRGSVSGSSLVLQWDGSGETVNGYNIYRADSFDGPFTRINRVLVGETRYDAAVPPLGRHVYMVRAQALQTTGSGSFHNHSQGAFFEFNREAPVIPEVSVRALTADAQETAGPLRFEFTRARNLESALTVNIQIGGTATSGQDYTAPGTSITFAAGASTAALNINLIQDNIAEVDETVTATISANDNYIIGTPNSANATIRGHGESSIRPPALSGTSFTFEVTGFANRNYRIESRTPAGQWRERRSGTSGQDGVVLYSEPAPAEPGGQFYRVGWQ